LPIERRIVLHQIILNNLLVSKNNEFLIENRALTFSIEQFLQCLLATPHGVHEIQCVENSNFRVIREFLQGKVIHTLNDGVDHNELFAHFFVAQSLREFRCLR